MMSAAVILTAGQVQAGQAEDSHPAMPCTSTMAARCTHRSTATSTIDISGQHLKHVRRTQTRQTPSSNLVPASVPALNSRFSCSQSRSARPRASSSVLPPIPSLLRCLSPASPSPTSPEHERSSTWRHRQLPDLARKAGPCRITVPHPRTPVPRLPHPCLHTPRLRKASRESGQVTDATIV